MIDTGLKDRAVLITGANHGIGAAAALAFAREGARVFINFLRLSAKEYGGIEEEEADKAIEPGRAFYYKALTTPANEVIRTIHELGGECYDW